MVIKNANAGGSGLDEPTQEITGDWTFDQGITVGNVTTNPPSNFVGSGDVTLGGNLVFENEGFGLKIRTGSNAGMGSATLVAGTVTVTNSSVKTASLIWLTRSVTGGTVGHLSYTIIDSTSFTISSSSVIDTSTINWLIIQPAPSTIAVIAATRGQIPTAVANITQNFTSRRTHWASPEGDITNLRAYDVNWYISNAFVPTATGVTLTFKRYIEYPAATFHQVTWSGVDLSILSGGVALSDVILSSVTGLPLVIPAGAKFWERSVKTSVGSQSVACAELPVGSTVIGIDDGNSASDLGNSGTVPATTGTTTFGSAWIQGDIGATNARAFTLIGDSIVFGTGDITAADSKFNTGWLARSIGSYPYFKIGKPSWSASDLAGSASALFTALFAALPVTDAIYEHGVNDLRLGRSQAALLADQQTNYARLGAGVRKWQTTITPRSDTTDAYATVVNQTPKTDGNMAALTSMNAAIRAVPANLAGIIDAADFAMSARDTNIWGGPFPPTTDGTHPTTNKAIAMAALYVP